MNKIQNSPCAQSFLAKPFVLVQLVRKNRRNANRNYNEAYSNRAVRDRLASKNLRSICEYLEFEEQTYFKTLGLIDSVSSKFLFDEPTFKKIALVCLGLMSKTQESVDKALYTNSLQLIMRHDKAEYARLEKLVLHAMDFDVNLAVPYEFVAELLRLEATFQGLNCNLFGKFRKFVARLLRRASLEYETNKYTSLAVALAIVMTARDLFGCAEKLPMRLRELTGYDSLVLAACFADIRALGAALMEKPSKCKQSFCSESTDLSSVDLSFD